MRWSVSCWTIRAAPAPPFERGGHGGGGRGLVDDHRRGRVERSRDLRAAVGTGRWVVLGSDRRRFSRVMARGATAQLMVGWLTDWPVACTHRAVCSARVASGWASTRAGRAVAADNGWTGRRRGCRPRRQPGCQGPGRRGRAPGRGRERGSCAKSAFLYPCGWHGGCGLSWEPGRLPSGCPARLRRPRGRRRTAAAPTATAQSQGGRPRLPDRDAFTGIVFVRKYTVSWNALPRELGVACWRRLRDWQQARVFNRLHLYLLDLVPSILTPAGRRRHRPDKPHADKADAYRKWRVALRRRRIRGRIARTGVESAQRLGRHRWVVERSFAWLGQFRRLTIRYERRRTSIRRLPSWAAP